MSASEKSFPRWPTCCTCSVRVRSATARPWVAIWSRPHQLETRPLFCWHWMPASFWPTGKGAHRADRGILRRVSKDGAESRGDSEVRSLCQGRGETADAQRKFYKVSKRREMDISTVAACFFLELGLGTGYFQRATCLWRRGRRCQCERTPRKARCSAGSGMNRPLKRSCLCWNASLPRSRTCAGVRLTVNV